jgi:hypothetical protein
LRHSAVMKGPGRRCNEPAAMISSIAPRRSRSGLVCPSNGRRVRIRLGQFHGT